MDKVDSASSGNMNGFQMELKSRRTEYEKIVFSADELAGKATEDCKKKLKHHLELLKERWTSAEEKVKN